MFKRIWPIFLVVFIDNLGWTMILPLLPYWAEKWGASPEKVGLLFSAYALSQMIASPIMGKLADRYGRKPILVISLMGSAISFLWLATAQSFTSILLSRILDGITAGTLPVAHAVASDMSKKEERSKAFGFLAIAYGLAFVVGPLLSATLFKFGYSVPILVACGISCLSVLAALKFLKNPPVPREESKPITKLQLGLPILSLGAYFIAFNVFTSGFALFAERLYHPGGHSFGPVQLAWIYSFVGVVGILTQGAMVRNSHRLPSEFKLVIFGFILSVIGFGGLSFVAEQIPIFSVVTCAAIGTAILRPTLTARISRLVSASNQGQAMGISQAAHGIAQLSSPMLSGALIGADFLSGWTMAIVAALVASFALGLKKVKT